MREPKAFLRTRLPEIAFALVILALAAPALRAQVSTSPNFTLEIVATPSAAGFTVSVGSIGVLATDSVLGSNSSAGFNLDYGVLAAAPFAPITGPRVISVFRDSGSCVGGDFINILGINFTEPGATNLLVQIGDAPPFIPVVVSGSELLVATPAGSAGPVNVTVSTSLGSDTLIGGFTYVCPSGPPVAFYTITPDIGEPDGGTLVTVTGLSLIPGTQLTFDGVPATDLLYIDDQTLQARTPAHARGFATPTVSNIMGVSSIPDGYLYRFSALVLSLGGGCPGVDGTPLNFISGALPVIGGAPFTNEIASARPSAVVYFVISVPVAGQLLPGTDCLVFVDIETAYLFVDTFTTPSGTAGYTFFIPNDPAFEGFAINSQWGVLDAASPVGLAVSNALYVRVGY